MSFDYNAPAGLFLSKVAKGGRIKYRRFATAAEALRYAIEELRTPQAFGAWLRSAMSASTVAKFSDSTKLMIIRCGSHKRPSADPPGADGGPRLIVCQNAKPMLGMSSPSRTRNHEWGRCFGSKRNGRL